MFKKVFSVILLVFAILLSGQVTVTPKAEAYADFVMVNDYYAFTDNGIEYYINYVQYNDEIYGGGIQVELKGVKNGKTVDNLKYLLNRNGTYDLLSSGRNERGYIQSDGSANTVWKIINSSEFKKEANKPREVQQKENKIREYEQKNKELTKEIANHPNWGFLYRSRGNTYVELGQHELAIQDYNKALELEPNEDYNYSCRGKAYAKLKQYELAIQDYNKVIELKPNDSSGYFDRGEVYTELKQYELAIQDYNKVIELEPNKSSGYFLRAEVYAQMKQYKQAIKDYRRAAELEPDKIASKSYMMFASELSKKK